MNHDKDQPLKRALQRITDKISLAKESGDLTKSEMRDLFRTQRMIMTIIDKTQESPAGTIDSFSNYQINELQSQSVEKRIEDFRLKSYSSADRTLLDTGASNGKFTAQLAHLFKSVTAVEPYAEPVPQPNNVSWIKQGFKDFCDSNNQQFDLVLAIAVTIQIEYFDGLDVESIAHKYHDLTSDLGLLVWNEPNYPAWMSLQQHSEEMVDALSRTYARSIDRDCGDNGHVHYFFKM